MWSASEHQWPTAGMSCSSPMDTGSENGSTSSGEDELDCQSISSREDEPEYQRTPSGEDDSDYVPTSSEDDLSDCEALTSAENESDHGPPSPPEEDDPDYELTSSSDDEWDYESRRARKPNNDITFHQESVTLEKPRLRTDIGLEVGTVISIGDTLELHDGSFLNITRFERSQNDRPVEFSGHLLRHIEEFRDYLPVTFSGSELVCVCEAKEHEPKPEGYLRSATSRDVLRIRHLVSFNPQSASGSVPKIGVSGMFTDPRPLFCHWFLVAELSDSHIRGAKRGFRSIMKGSKTGPKAFITLPSHESSNNETEDANSSSRPRRLDTDLPRTKPDRGPYQSKVHERVEGRNNEKGKERSRGAWRDMILAPHTKGNRIAKATYRAIRNLSHHFVMSLALVLEISSAQRLVSEQSIEPHIYTFADAFCGAGGMSVGAKDAGLRIQWAFDKNRDAVKTYSKNHGNGICENISARKLLALSPGNKFETSGVDILHLSPPCQGFSRAARGRASNREENNSCMTHVHDIVRKVKPRIMTFEQVPEVLSRHKTFFTSMVRALTSIGYSVRWKVLECADFGVPQERKRLFMIASCQGEPLPDFPKPTHSHYPYCNELGLQRWNSFQGAIDSLEDSAPNHVFKHPRRVRRIENRAQTQPPDWPCQGTITRGANWPDHYSGKYHCTPREAACLQGFAADYGFCGNLESTRQQVVNAVPPPIAKAILEEVKRSLMRTDALRSS